MIVAAKNEAGYTDKDVRSPTAALVEAEAKGTAARAKGIEGVVGGVGGTISGVAKAFSDPISAYFEAEANKEIARQRTAQAALKENQPILHELDVPFITLKMDLGTKKKPIPFTLNFTLLNIFGLGDLAERIYADILTVKSKNTPNNFSKEWDDVRTPRTQVSGYNVTSITTTGTAAGANQVEAERIFADWLANVYGTTGRFATRAERAAKRAELGLQPGY